MMYPELVSTLIGTIGVLMVFFMQKKRTGTVTSKSDNQIITETEL